MKIKITKYPLIFKRASGTSRGVLHQKNTWFLQLFENMESERFGLGEINMFEGLSCDDRPEFYHKLAEVEQNPELFLKYPLMLQNFPSIRFGLEMAILDFENQKKRILFPSEFTKGNEGIPINGLIWMGEKEFMLKQIKQKLDAGFRCLKLKIGAIDFETELDILKSIRGKFNKQDLELRVDANGAFDVDVVLHRLEALSQFKLHSIEQPIKQGQIIEMADLCSKTPLPIALDEELIGKHDLKLKRELLDKIKPQYIILKPALLGGFQASQEWITLADERKIGWWVTSALESNIGLNAIAQWTFQLKSNHYQGLGTGQLYTNNIPSPLLLKKDIMFYEKSQQWDLNPIVKKKN